jgi:hypothetical protein
VKGVLTIFILFLLNSVQAQHTNEFWSKLNTIKRITGKTDIGMDLQHRRQNGVEGDYNLLRYGMTNSVRLWIYHKISNDYTIVLSPVTLFQNRAIKNSSDEIQKSNEVRTMAGLIKGFTIGKSAGKSRVLYELTFIDVEHSKITRHRYRLQNSLLLPLIKLNSHAVLNYSVANEILIKTVGSETRFDQNRFYNAIQWKGKQQDISIGHQWTLQSESGTIHNKNQLVVSINTYL